MATDLIAADSRARGLVLGLIPGKRGRVVGGLNEKCSRSD